MAARWSATSCRADGSRTRHPARADGAHGRCRASSFPASCSLTPGSFDDSAHSWPPRLCSARLAAPRAAWRPPVAPAPTAAAMRARLRVVAAPCPSAAPRVAPAAVAARPSLASSWPRRRTSARCSARRSVVWAICSRQLKPSATISVSAGARRAPRAAAPARRPRSTRRSAPPRSRTRRPCRSSRSRARRRRAPIRVSSSRSRVHAHERLVVAVAVHERLPPPRRGGW